MRIFLCLKMLVPRIWLFLVRRCFSTFQKLSHKLEMRFFALQLWELAFANFAHEVGLEVNERAFGLFHCARLRLFLLLGGFLLFGSSFFGLARLLLGLLELLLAAHTFQSIWILSEKALHHLHHVHELLRITLWCRLHRHRHWHHSHWHLLRKCS